MAASAAAAAEIDVRVRRSVDDLSRLDVTRLRRAFRAMMATEGDRGYSRWAGIHGLPLPIYGRHGDLGLAERARQRPRPVAMPVPADGRRALAGNVPSLHPVAVARPHQRLVELGLDQPFDEMPDLVANP